MLSQHYYVGVEMMQQAIRRCSSFNVIHLATMFKIAVFVPEDTPFARANMQRRVALDVPEVGRLLYICAPEDIVLHKLVWYQAGASATHLFQPCRGAGAETPPVYSTSSSRPKKVRTRSIISSLG